LNAAAGVGVGAGAGAVFLNAAAGAGAGAWSLSDSLLLLNPRIFSCSFAVGGSIALAVAHGNFPMLLLAQAPAFATANAAAGVGVGAGAGFVDFEHAQCFWFPELYCKHTKYIDKFEVGCWVYTCTMHPPGRASPEDCHVHGKGDGGLCVVAGVCVCVCVVHYLPCMLWK